eukprot:CAMPEP_0117510360 /NCGR_PEP_ID=MMETSP0784-20121206/27951_1 /TAXON_ID=39447 /ORGANISM="" /LENGTH=494 /DNA_ID=CAMNT_0005305997 /DNA_START=206 /DNA_END=1690 /DNA_ORIENTATION=+
MPLSISPSTPRCGARSDGPAAMPTPPGLVASPTRSAAVQGSMKTITRHSPERSDYPEDAPNSAPRPSYAMTPTAGELILGRYRILEGKPLGEGGWCMVLRGQDERDPGKRGVAVKTFRAQVLRETGEAALASRFANEVAIFQDLSLVQPPSENAYLVRTQSGGGRTAGQLFVNMLDHSPIGGAVGLHYSVLELANEALDAWLDRRSSARDFVSLDEMRELARSLTAALSWMHNCDLCHLDVKPANIMHFGTRWKLIDFEGAVHLKSLAPTSLDLGLFTPLYACPEVARAVLASTAVSDGSSSLLEGLAPSAKMDAWSCGVVLLDVLAHECAFQEIWSGFQAQAMMSLDGGDEGGGLGFLRDWYDWVADPAPVVAAEYASSIPSSAAMLKASGDLQSLLVRLLAKDPGARSSDDEVLRHPFLALVPQQERGTPAEAPVFPQEERAENSTAGTSEAPDEEAFPPRAKRGFGAKCCMAICGRSSRETRAARGELARE